MKNALVRLYSDSVEPLNENSAWIWESEFAKCVAWYVKTSIDSGESFKDILESLDVPKE